MAYYRRGQKHDVSAAPLSRDSFGQVPSVYTVPNYNRMIADHARVEAYSRALQQAVRPDSVVVDIGTGTGIMTLLACRFGARRVFAIEPDDVIQVAREVIRANGYADRVEFFQQPSASVTPPERADVVVSDLRGILPLYQLHLPTIVDARKRLLKPGGVLIPHSDTLWAALAEVPDVYADHVAVQVPDSYQFDFGPARRRACNDLLKARVSPEQLLADPQRWATLDYLSLESPHVSAELHWKARRGGTAHGVVLWFDTVLGPGAEFSNSPATPELVYGRALLPFEHPVLLETSDAISLGLHANLVKNDYLWRWNLHVTDGTNARVKANFTQSSFYAAPLSPAQLRKQSADFVPELNADAQVDILILTHFREGKSLVQIARCLVEAFPGRFHSEADALTHVAELSLKYSR